MKRIECQIIFLANIYLFKVNNRETRKSYEIVNNVNDEDIGTTSMTYF